MEHRCWFICDKGITSRLDTIMRLYMVLQNVVCDPGSTISNPMGWIIIRTGTSCGAGQKLGKNHKHESFKSFVERKIEMKNLKTQPFQSYLLYFCSPLVERQLNLFKQVKMNQRSRSQANSWFVLFLSKGILTNPEYWHGGNRRPDLPGADAKGLFWIETSDSYNRTAEEIADQEMTYATGVDVGRWTLTLGGEQAWCWMVCLVKTYSAGCTLCISRCSTSSHSCQLARRILQQAARWKRCILQ